MRVIPPLTITEAMLTSVTAVEPGIGEAAWASGTTYAAGDKVILGAPSSTVTITIASPGVVTWNAHGLPDGTPVILTTSGALPTGLTASQLYYVVNRTTNTFQLATEANGSPIVTTGSQSGTHTATAHIHRRYQSLVGSNSANPPAIDDGTKWLDIGPTNKWAAYDLLRNTGTVTTSPQVHEITPGQRVDAIGLVGLVADTVLVEVIVSGVTVYSYTRSLLERDTISWYGYFFGAFRYQSSVALFDLPPYSGAKVRVTLTRASGNVTCGGLILGRSVYLGGTQKKAESDALNFSKIERDDFGNSSLVPRRTVPKTNQVTQIDKALVDQVLIARDALNAVPALWSGLDDASNSYFEALLILGIYKRFLVTVDSPPSKATVSLELEEV